MPDAVLVRTRPPTLPARCTWRPHVCWWDVFRGSLSLWTPSTSRFSGVRVPAFVVLSFLIALWSWSYFELAWLSGLAKKSARSSVRPYRVVFYESEVFGFFCLILFYFCAIYSFSIETTTPSSQRPSYNGEIAGLPGCSFCEVLECGGKRLIGSINCWNILTEEQINFSHLQFSRCLGCFFFRKMHKINLREVFLEH